MSDEIRTRPATQEYRDGWERTFRNHDDGADEEPQSGGECAGFLDKDGVYHPAPGYNVILTGLEP